MRKSILVLLISVSFLAASCSSGGNNDAVRASTFYTTSAEYWDTFSSSWKNDVCQSMTSPDDKEGLKKSVTVMKMMLMANLGIETDITKDDGYTDALTLLLSENC
jgi:hypothetical protein